MKILDVSSIQNIPGYVEILKFVLKSQIQNLVEQLQDHAGEETLVLSANLTAGTLSHVESERGQGFLDVREDIKSQFLTHCLQGKQKYHTAEPPGHCATGLQKLVTTGLTEPGMIRISPGNINRTAESGEAEPQKIEQNKPADQNRMSLTDINTTMQSTSDGFKLSQCHRQPLSEGSGMYNAGVKHNHTVTSSLSSVNMDKRFPFPIDSIVQQKLAVNNTAPPGQIGQREREEYPVFVPDRAAVVSSQSSSKETSSFFHGQLANLPTINHSAVKDFISFSLNASSLAQPTQPCQPNLTSVKLTDANQSSLPSIKSCLGSGLIFQEPVPSSVSLPMNQKHCAVQSSQHTFQDNASGTKSITGADLSSNSSAQNLNCPQDTRSENHDVKHVISGKEHTNKTTKRKQKRNPNVRLQTENVMLNESPTKKLRTFESVLTQNLVHTDQSKKIQTSSKPIEVGSVTTDVVNGNTSSSVLPCTSDFSLLNMQPVVLIDENEKTSRKIFIETGIANPAETCIANPAETCIANPAVMLNKCVSKNPRSLIFETNVSLENTGASKQNHVSDAKEKDKTKKTLSSKIDEITQRIRKDDAIKQHTVQTSVDGKVDIASNGTSKVGVSMSNNSEDVGGIETGRHDMTTPPSSEHLCDGDPFKLKDGSRASHRKPKLPRFNIGVASDDEDNAEVVESPRSVILDTPPQLVNGNSFGTSPNSVNISHEDSQDIINIQVGADDSETSFSHINLEELADGLLLTDIPMINYYNNVEDASRSLIDSVLNVKPGRDPGTKKPLNSQSVIVSGSKQEKDWVKCPLCPEKLLTVEALQYHIQSVNHVMKKYECDLCKRKFSQLRDMERHRRIHTGERPFTCDVCNKSFSRKDNLKSHARKHPLSNS